MTKTTSKFSQALKNKEYDMTMRISSHIIQIIRASTISVYCKGHHLYRVLKGEIMYFRSLVAWLILAPSDGKRSLERKLPLRGTPSIGNSSIQNLFKKSFTHEYDMVCVCFRIPPEATVETAKKTLSRGKSPSNGYMY